MTNNIIIGNIISFVAAVLLGLSCWCKNPKRVFIYQFIDNLVLSLSSIVFGPIRQRFLPCCPPPRVLSS